MLEELLSEWPKIAIGFVGGIGLLFAFGKSQQQNTIQSVLEKQRSIEKQQQADTETASINRLANKKLLDENNRLMTVRQENHERELTEKIQKLQDDLDKRSTTLEKELTEKIKHRQRDLDERSTTLEKELTEKIKHRQRDLDEQSHTLTVELARNRELLSEGLTVLEAVKQAEERMQNLSDRFDLISRSHADDNPDESQAAFNGYCVAETSNKARCSNKAQPGTLICALHDRVERAISIYPPIRDQIP